MKLILSLFSFFLPILQLVPKILATKQNGGSVEFLTTDRVLTKFFERFVLQKKSEYIDDDDNVIKMPSAQYDELGVRSLY